MSQRARVIIEVEENLGDEVDDESFEEYDEVDDIGDFAELVWRRRLEAIDMDGQIMNLACYETDN